MDTKATAVRVARGQGGAPELQWAVAAAEGNLGCSRGRGEGGGPPEAQWATGAPLPQWGLGLSAEILGWGGYRWGRGLNWEEEKEAWKTTKAH